MGPRRRLIETASAATASTLACCRLRGSGQRSLAPDENAAVRHGRRTTRLRRRGRRVPPYYVQLGEQVAEDRVAVDGADLTDQVSSGVMTPCAICSQDGTMDRHRRQPGRVDQPRDGTQIPQCLRPGEVVAVVTGDEVGQIVPDLAAAPNELVDLRPGRPKVLGHVDAGDVDERNPT